MMNLPTAIIHVIIIAIISTVIVYIIHLILYKLKHKDLSKFAHLGKFTLTEKFSGPTTTNYGIFLTDNGKYRALVDLDEGDVITITDLSTQKPVYELHKSSQGVSP